MTTIIGNEPHHWHDADGKHRMPDPRALDGYPRRWWDMDERAYVTHLETHEGEHTDPQRMSADSNRIKSLFDLADAKLREVEAIKGLIVEYRLADEFLKDIKR